MSTLYNYAYYVPNFAENMVVLELMSKGDLKAFLQVSSELSPAAHDDVSFIPCMQENPRSVTKLVKFMSDIVMGMHHLSGLKLVHRVSLAVNRGMRYRVIHAVEIFCIYYRTSQLETF